MKPIRLSLFGLVPATAVAVYAAGGHRALENFSKTRGEKVKLLTRQISKG